MEILYYTQCFTLERKTDGAVGFDLHANMGVPFIELGPGDIRVIPTGIYLQLVMGLEATARPRSGCTKDGLVAQLGTVDVDFRGLLGVILANIGRTKRVVRDGDRIAQLVISPVVIPGVPMIAAGTVFSLREVATLDELDKTVRGEGSFGSTGR